jgi:hypothetical protein
MAKLFTCIGDLWGEWIEIKNPQSEVDEKEQQGDKPAQLLQNTPKKGRPRGGVGRGSVCLRSFLGRSHWSFR